jgi:hypothetical protein
MKVLAAKHKLAPGDHGEHQPADGSDIQADRLEIREEKRCAWGPVIGILLGRRDG